MGLLKLFPYSISNWVSIEWSNRDNNVLSEQNAGPVQGSNPPVFKGWLQVDYKVPSVQLILDFYWPWTYKRQSTPYKIRMWRDGRNAAKHFIWWFYQLNYLFLSYHLAICNGSIYIWFFYSIWYIVKYLFRSLDTGMSFFTVGSIKDVIQNGRQLFLAQGAQNIVKSDAVPYNSTLAVSYGKLDKEKFIMMGNYAQVCI